MVLFLFIYKNIIIVTQKNYVNIILYKRKKNKVEELSYREFVITWNVYL